MALAEREPAAGKAAPLVSVMEHPPKRRRNGPSTGADLDDLAIRGVPHHHAARVARQASGRFRGNVRAVLEDGLAGRLRIRQHRGLDMDDHLVALSRGAGIDSRVEGCLREQRQRVRLLLGHRGRFRGTQHVAIATPRPAETRYASRVEGTEVGHVTGADRARRGT